MKLSSISNWAIRLPASSTIGSSAGFPLSNWRAACFYPITLTRDPDTRPSSQRSSAWTAQCSLSSLEPQPPCTAAPLPWCWILSGFQRQWYLHASCATPPHLGSFSRSSPPLKDFSFRWLVFRFLLSDTRFRRWYHPSNFPTVRWCWLH